MPGQNITELSRNSGRIFFSELYILYDTLYYILMYEFASKHKFINIWKANG